MLGGSSMTYYWREVPKRTDRKQCNLWLTWCAKLRRTDRKQCDLWLTWCTKKDWPEAVWPMTDVLYEAKKDWPEAVWPMTDVMYQKGLTGSSVTYDWRDVAKRTDRKQCDLWLAWSAQKDWPEAVWSLADVRCQKGLTGSSVIYDWREVPKRTDRKQCDLWLAWSAKKHWPEAVCRGEDVAVVKEGAPTRGVGDVDHPGQLAPVRLPPPDDATRHRRRSLRNPAFCTSVRLPPLVSQSHSLQVTKVPLVIPPWSHSHEGISGHFSVKVTKSLGYDGDLPSVFISQRYHWSFPSEGHKVTRVSLVYLQCLCHKDTIGHFPGKVTKSRGYH